MFPPVWKRFNKFLLCHNLLRDPASVAFLTYDKDDLNEILPDQLAYEVSVGSDVEDIAPFGRISRINIKKSFRRHYRLKHRKPLAGMMNQLVITKDENYHFGMEEC